MINVYKRKVLGNMGLPFTVTGNWIKLYSGFVHSVKQREDEVCVDL